MRNEQHSCSLSCLSEGDILGAYELCIHKMVLEVLVH